MTSTAAPWKPSRLDEGAPLYLAIAEALASDVAAGRLTPGQRLPPQRRLAELIGVDLGTVTRALTECRRRGLVEGTVGRGTFVTADAGTSDSMADPEPDGPLIEMGLVLPLYRQERRLAAFLTKSLASLDVERYLRYADAAGMVEHREAGAAWVARAGVKAAAGSILVTAGSQNAIACCLLALLRPGDCLAVEELTFPGLKTLARMQDVRLVPVAMDGEGILPDALERACRREHPRGVYLMPDCQNPTATSIPGDRRTAIARIIEKHNLALIEDDVYGHTVGRHKALSALLPDHGIYIGGISKLFGAGLRVSFVACPARFRARLQGAILGTVWMASPLNAALASQVIASGEADAIMSAKWEEARARMALARRALSPHLDRARGSGYFTWLGAPRGWTGRELELAARQAGVRIFGAERFAVGGRAAPPAVRLSLTGPETRGELSRGLQSIAGLLSRGGSPPSAIL